MAHGERLVDGGEEIFCEVWGERDDGFEVVGCVFGVEAPQEVESGVEWVGGHDGQGEKPLGSRLDVSFICR